MSLYVLQPANRCRSFRTSQLLYHRVTFFSRVVSQTVKRKLFAHRGRVQFEQKYWTRQYLTRHNWKCPRTHERGSFGQETNVRLRWACNYWPMKQNKYLWTGTFRSTKLPLSVPNCFPCRSSPYFPILFLGTADTFACVTLILDLKNFTRLDSKQIRRFNVSKNIVAKDTTV